MKHVNLSRVEHTYKVGNHAQAIQPNVHEDCILLDNNVPIGLFVADVSMYDTTLAKLLAYADAEFRGSRVPKSMMERKQLIGLTEDGRKRYRVVQQYSTILGSIPKKPHMKRNYHSRSSVHLKSSATQFVRAMLVIADLSYQLVERLAPEVYDTHMASLATVDEAWKFGKHCTSSISNFNIAAAYHQDNANVKGTVNCILTKRANSSGGNLHVPDYDAVFDQCDNSLLVYPAWRNLHAVTPIVETQPGGYRNSFIFYSLKGFTKDATDASTEES